MQEVERTPPLAYRVAEAIRDYIVEQKLGAGDKLPSERTFSQRLGVSRNVVREALRALELSGIIEKRHGKGAFVRLFDPSLLARQISFGLSQDQTCAIQLLEARLALERAAVPLVVRHATEKDLDEMDALVSEMAEKEQRRESVLEEDLAFHKALLKATHNEPLNRFSSVISEWMEQYAAPITCHENAGRPARKMSGLHRPIVDALRQGDVARACRLIDDHIEVSAVTALSGASNRGSGARSSDSDNTEKQSNP